MGQKKVFPSKKKREQVAIIIFKGLHLKKHTAVLK